MGITLTIKSANYSSAGGFDSDVQAYATASGINDVGIRSALNSFVRNLKLNGLWDKIGYLYPILGTSYNQIKLNLKDLSSAPLANVAGGSIANTINKGIVLTGAANVGGAQVELPVPYAYVAAMESQGGHVLYFLNENLSASSTVIPGLGTVLGNTNSSSSSDSTFAFSGSYLSPTKKTLLLAGGSYSINPPYTTKGAFAVVHKGTGLGISFYGNKVLLGSQVTKVAGGAPVPAARLTIGVSGSYPINNTVSLVSFGHGVMSDTDMVLYQDLINTLIQTVHGIVV